MTLSRPYGSPWGRRRLWQRLERRARAHFEQDLLATLRQVAEAAPHLRFVDVDEPGSGSAQIARIHLSRATVTLAGVHPRERVFLREAVAQGRGLRLVDGGRYGRHWWIRVSDG